MMMIMMMMDDNEEAQGGGEWGLGMLLLTADCQRAEESRSIMRC